jgi:hypothetical protein
MSICLIERLLVVCLQWIVQSVIWGLLYGKSLQPYSMEIRDAISGNVGFSNLACAIILDKEVSSIVGDSFSCLQWTVQIIQLALGYKLSKFPQTHVGNSVKFEPRMPCILHRTAIDYSAATERITSK